MNESPTRRRVREMLEDGGTTLRAVAEELGISTQRVHQHFQALGAEATPTGWRLPKERATP